LSEADPLDVIGALRAVLENLDVEMVEPSPGTFVVMLPGERKLNTTCVMVVGRHSVSVSAFVARRPNENHEAVYRWLLERNARMYAVSFALDPLGDIYVAGRVPLSDVTEVEVDRLLGAVVDAADSAFNSILELGFSSAIRKEWAWRRKRGESTANLDSFQHLAPTTTDPRVDP
jgi:hypothetical protein